MAPILTVPGLRILPPSDTLPYGKKKETFSPQLGYCAHSLISESTAATNKTAQSVAPELPKELPFRAGIFFTCPTVPIWPGIPLKDENTANTEANAIWCQGLRNASSRSRLLHSTVMTQTYRLREAKFSSLSAKL